MISTREVINHLNVYQFRWSSNTPSWRK